MGTTRGKLLLPIYLTKQATVRATQLVMLVMYRGPSLFFTPSFYANFLVGIPTAHYRPPRAYRLVTPHRPGTGSCSSRHHIAHKRCRAEPWMPARLNQALRWKSAQSPRLDDTTETFGGDARRNLKAF